jgi:hypothetical protein
MSALGQKRTYAAQKGMSAATAKADSRKRLCLLLPPKADMCSALVDVRFGPKADIGLHPDRMQGQRRNCLTTPKIQRLRSRSSWKGIATADCVNQTISAKVSKPFMPNGRLISRARDNKETHELRAHFESYYP